MAVHYVGDEPTRITCYTERKNITRWMSKPSPRMKLPSFEDILYVVTTIVAVMVVFVFIFVCFR